MRTDEPEVLTWAIAIAKWREPAPPRRHWWREMITDAWRSATDAWEAEQEAVAIGYATEMAEFRYNNPPPRLRDFMVHCSTGRWSPEQVMTP